jgi:hypothetical protein
MPLTVYKAKCTIIIWFKTITDKNGARELKLSTTKKEVLGLKKSLKRCALCLTAVLMFLPLGKGIFSYAEEENTDDGSFMIGGDLADDDPQTAIEQYQEMLNDPDVSEAECQEFYNRMFRSDFPNYIFSQISMVILDVPYYEQETTYYGGPATAAQTIAFFNGSAEDQSTIWLQIKARGENSTVGEKLRKYVNSQQNTNTYELKYPSSTIEMRNDIYSDLSRGVPVILWVKVTKGGDWEYSTSGGHFLIASGIDAGGALIEVTDPYIGYVSGSPYSDGKYWITLKEAYDATIARGVGYYM